MPFITPLIVLGVRARIAGTDFRDHLEDRLHHDLGDELGDDAGAVAIEYVIVAVALLAIAGAIAAALTALGDDAVQQIPDSVSNTGG